MIRYVEAFPADLQRALDRQALVVWPLGALEWHGNHLPLGTDGLLAEAHAERLAEALDGVLLPMAWLPMTTLPSRFSLDILPSTFVSIIEDQLRALSRSGWRSVAVVSGHYAQGQEIVLYRAARALMDEVEGLRVFAAAPLEPLGDPMLDHAGQVETAQMLDVRPDLVRIADASSEAVIGDPPAQATELLGREWALAAVEAWQDWIAKSDRPALHAHYEGAEARYHPYVERYFRGDWDEAIRAWWSDRLA